MKMPGDEQVDALYEEVKSGIILDFNAAGEVVGIEVASASGT